MRHHWGILAALLASAGLQAQGTGTSDPGFLSLQKLLDTPVEVASLRPAPTRESPGVITLITREEITATGARDLMDVLRLVPGFEFASDSQGAVGIGFRSTFGHIGKVLLLWDGQEMNEPMYGTTQFGGHYPLEAVQRIEIIRGPGSAIYGGFAELAVIKVTTRKGADLNGPSGSLWLSSMEGILNRSGSLAYGRAWGDMDFSMSYTGGLGSRGNGDWPLPDGTSLSLANPSLGRLSTDFLNLGFTKGDWGLRYIRDLYTVSDFTQEFRPGNPPMTFRSEFLEGTTRFKLGQGWTLVPRLSVKRQAPWYYRAIGTLDTTRATFGLNAQWDISPSLAVLLGSERVRDRAEQYRRPPTYLGKATYAYDNQAYIVQTSWSPGWMALDLGARLDRHSQFGTSLSPRLAIGHVESRWHLKALAAGAYRAPAIAELRENPSLKPEHTNTFEVEAGLKLGASSYLSVNLFWLRIRDPISYVILLDGADSFANFHRTGSRGVEFDLQTRLPEGSVRTTLSLATAQDKEAYFYQVSGNDRYHVGLPNLKFTTQAQWRLADRWSFNPNLVLLGPRYGYRLGETRATRFDGIALLNLWAVWSPGWPKTEVGFGIYNAMGSDNTLIQGYGVPGTGGSPPMPGPGREIAVRLSYAF